MRKTYRNLLAFLLAGIMILQPFSVLAEEKACKPEQQGTLELIQRGSLVYAETDSGTGQSLFNIPDDDKESVKQLIYEGLTDLKERIDVSEYELPLEEFQAILQDMLNTSPEFFYVGKGYSYTVFCEDEGLEEKEKRRVSCFYPSYEKNGIALSEPEIERMRAELDAVVIKVLSKVNPEWSDREKALYIHDYLAAQYEYDTRDPKPGTDSCEYDMYSLLVEGRAVCEGYALTFLYFMKQLGIPCATVPSNSMNHMWNQVQLDGEWYHVDVTRDDPLNDMPGRVSHSYFLLSDSALTSQGYIWDTANANVCADTTYDSYFWKDSDSPIVSDGTNWFFVNNSGNAPGIYRWDPVTYPAVGSLKKVVNLSSYNWKSADGGIFLSKFTKLAVHGGKVYFNTPENILCFDTDAAGVITGEPAPEVTGTISGTIFGIRLRDEELEYITAVPTLTIVDGREVNVIVPSEPQTACTFEVPDATYPPVSTASSLVKPSVTKNPSVESGTGERKEEEDSGTETSPGNVSEDNTAENISTVNTGQTVSPGVQENQNGQDLSVPGNGNETKSLTKTDILSQIKITASKGKKKITVRVPKKTRTVISLNKKIICNKKKRCKKLTITAKKNKSGKVVLKLSSKLKKKMKIIVTISVAGKKYKKTVRV